MELNSEQIAKIADLVEDGWMSIGASQSSGKIFYVLKAINDEIKATGLDWQYELNEKGRKLQDLYEEIYAANARDLD